MASKIVHVLAFPFGSAGHIHPMLHFCKRLALEGLKVTLIIAAGGAKYAPQQSDAEAPVSIEIISDGSGEGYKSKNLEDYFNRFESSVSKSLEELIISIKQKNPPTILVYDSGMPWCFDIAKRLGLQAAAFFTHSCAVSAIFYQMHRGVEKIDDAPAISLPSTLIEIKDLPSFSFFKDSMEAVLKSLLKQFSNAHLADYLFFNTFDKLEEEIIKWVGSQLPVKTIGPAVPWMDQVDQPGNNINSLDLLKPNLEECMKWLDKRELGSVIYVSFGSVASLNELQMEEIARGLLNSNNYFLWVVRSSEEHKLPKDYKSEAERNKGLVVNWCPQCDVLAHQAVACFMTHCGWNSTLEAISLGVPMLAMPQWVDQTTNAKFIEDVWHIGIQVKPSDENGFATGEEIVRSIHEMTQGERWMELKANALKWKQLAKDALNEGGSSHKNIKDFVSSLLSSSLSSC